MTFSVGQFSKKGVGCSASTHGPGWVAIQQWMHKNYFYLLSHTPRDVKLIMSVLPSLLTTKPTFPYAEE